MKSAPLKVLVVDLGGTHIKILASGKRSPRKVDSGQTLGPAKFVRAVEALAEGWEYEAIAIGYPGLVIHGRIASEPHNLGGGWVNFDFDKAFKRPVKVINDAAMQALGSYHGGRLLFLGLGTGLGSAMIVDGFLEPMELAHLPYKKGRTFEEYVGAAGLARVGKKKWRHEVSEVVATLSAALEPDDVVLGGGNVKKLKALPAGCRLGNNLNAFAGGVRLWKSPAPGGLAGGEGRLAAHAGPAAGSPKARRRKTRGR